MNTRTVQLTAFDFSLLQAKEKEKRYVLKPADIALLEAVYRLRYMTAEQLLAIVD